MLFLTEKLQNNVIRCPFVNIEISVKHLVCRRNSYSFRNVFRKELLDLNKLNTFPFKVFPYCFQ